jgi:hypothetical protein
MISIGLDMGGGAANAGTNIDAKNIRTIANDTIFFIFFSLLNFYARNTCDRATYNPCGTLFQLILPRSHAVKRGVARLIKSHCPRFFALSMTRLFFESPVSVAPDYNPNDYKNYENNKQSTR